MQHYKEKTVGFLLRMGLSCQDRQAAMFWKRNGLCRRAEAISLREGPESAGKRGRAAEGQITEREQVQASERPAWRACVQYMDLLGMAFRLWLD
jgi:hypothetical protein